MGPLLTLAVLIAMTGAPGAAPDPALDGASSGWALSGVESSPWYNEDIPFSGERTLYLWQECSFGVGWTAATFSLGGTFELVSLTPRAGFTSTGTLPLVELQATDCREGWELVADLVVRDTTGTGGNVCFVGKVVASDCNVPPVLVISGHHGFSTDGTECFNYGCPVDYVIPGSWGRVKSLFQE